MPLLKSRANFDFTVFVPILLFLLYRPYLDSQLLLRIGESISLAIALLFILVRSSYLEKRSVIVSSAIIFFLSYLSIFYHSAFQGAQDYVDPVRFLFPILALHLGECIVVKRLNVYKIIIGALLPSLLLLLIQHYNLLSTEFELIYNVKELVRWNRSAGSFTNHIEPTWLVLALVFILRGDNSISVSKKLGLFLLIFLPFLLTRSKAYMLVAGFSVVLLFDYKKVSRLKALLLISVIGVLIVLLLSSSEYFMHSFNLVVAGEMNRDPSTYVRFLDFKLVIDELSSANLWLIGNGPSSIRGYDSYMGTSILMIIYRYGVIVLFLYHYLLYTKLKERGGVVLLFFIIFFDLISNGSEALKGLFLFWFLIGLRLRD